MPNIENFKTAFKGSGARSNLFKIEFLNDDIGAAESLEGDNDGQSVVSFMCKVASLPSSTITPIDVFYQGRTIKVAGTRPAYADWTVTIINDEDMKIRRALEKWMFNINSTVDNTMEGGPDMSYYKGTANCWSLSKTGDTVLGGYRFIGLFPNNIGEVSLDWSQDAIQEYTVTFSYDYFTDLDNTALDNSDSSVSVVNSAIGNTRSN